MKKKYAIGVDIGGSHISCALVDLEEKDIYKESLTTQKIDNQAESKVILYDWSSALLDCMKYIDKQDLAGIGFAMPDPFNYPEGIALFTHEVAKYEKLNGVNVAKELSDRLDLGSEKFRFINDATAFAVGESWFGEAEGAKRLLSITLGTGFGSAFIDNGLPVVERNDVPKMGCVWHLKFHDGIADDYFSTRWFIKQYQEISGKHVNGVKEIAEDAAKKKAAKDLFNEFGTNIGEFLGPWLNKFNADVLVIGGNVSGAYNLFKDAFESSLKSQYVKTVIKISKLMESSALAGSAHMFNEDFWQDLKPLLGKMK